MMMMMVMIKYSPPAMTSVKRLEIETVGSRFHVFGFVGASLCCISVRHSVASRREPRRTSFCDWKWNLVPMSSGSLILSMAGGAASTRAGEVALNDRRGNQRLVGRKSMKLERFDTYLLGEVRTEVHYDRAKLSVSKEVPDTSRYGRRYPGRFLPTRYFVRYLRWSGHIR